MAKQAWSVPMPGAKRIERHRENCAGTAVTFTAADLQDIRRHLDTFEIEGARYPEEQERMTGL